MLGVPLGAKLWWQTKEIKIYFLFGKEGTAHYFLFCQGDKTKLSGYNKNHLGLGDAVVSHLSQCITNADPKFLLTI